MSNTRAEPSISWPGGETCAAAFSFDVDGESAALAANPASAHSMSIMSHQSYGPLIGVRRILDMLDQHGIRSTFFVPGYTADRHPTVVRDIVAAGHEIAHHGYDHIRPTQLDAAAQAEQLDRGLDALERVARVRPTGYRAPMWDLSWDMPALLAERDFVYDSSLMDADLPYVLNTNTQDPAHISTLIEIPIQWALDDWEQYCFLPDISELGPIETPRNAVELWSAELDGMRKYGGCWVLTNHPFLSGRPGRASALDALMGAVTQMSDVWLGTLDEIAAHVGGLGLTARSIPPITDA